MARGEPVMRSNTSPAKQSGRRPLPYQPQLSPTERAAETRERRAHWLAGRIRDHHGYDALDGLVDDAELVKRLRSAINTFGLDHVVVGRGADRKPLTYGQAFERTFGEKL